MSIDLPHIQIPLANRDLIGTDRQMRSVSLEELLDRMMVAFIIARDTFVAVETAWIELESKLIITHRSLVKLQQLAQKLQVAIPASLVTAQANFNDFQLQIERDPLGINLAFVRDVITLINSTRGNSRTRAMVGAASRQI